MLMLVVYRFPAGQNIDRLNYQNDEEESAQGRFYKERFCRQIKEVRFLRKNMAHLYR
jgi:hypothetical protein